MNFNGQRALVATFVICVLLIVWDEVQEVKVFPRPSRFVSAGLVFIVLGIISIVGAPQLAAAFGAAVDISLLYRFKWAKGNAGASKQPPPPVTGGEQKQRPPA